MGANKLEMVRDTYDRSSPANFGDDLIAVRMDESDWNFVIDCLRYRARTGAGDTAERATFTADSIQDVIG
jgi:hypothetical protein